MWQNEFSFYEKRQLILPILDLNVYCPLYGEGGLWIRPLEMFVERVEFNGQILLRFAYTGE
jgi:hypothetical protein